MNLKDCVVRILQKTVLYKGVRIDLKKAVNPITLTYSTTVACQSRCRTCNIGLKFQKDPERNRKDLELEEIIGRKTERHRRVSKKCQHFLTRSKSSKFSKENPYPVAISKKRSCMI
jgi:hypothetical protein